MIGLLWGQTLSRMQALTAGSGWTYDISFEITNLDNVSSALFRISQDRNIGGYIPSLKHSFPSTAINAGKM